MNHHDVSQGFRNPSIMGLGQDHTIMSPLVLSWDDNCVSTVNFTIFKLIMGEKRTLMTMRLVNISVNNHNRTLNSRENVQNLFFIHM